MIGQALKISPFRQAVSSLPDRLQALLLAVPLWEQDKITEIRLYAGQPVTLFKNRDVSFLQHGGALSAAAEEGCPKLTQQDVEECFRTLCGYSVHSHQEEICQGFLSLPGGHRAGICGTAVYSQGRHTGFRQITSVNMRIARPAIGCAEALFRTVFQGRKPRSLLLAGAPATGKTTLLRDLARLLAGPQGGYCPVAIVDERGELSAGDAGFGVTAHVLRGLPKAQGILQAVRTLAPRYILCDELGTLQEAQAMVCGLNAGVKIIATVHAGSREELLRKEQVQVLLKAHGFDAAAFLKSDGEPGQIKELWEAEKENVQGGRQYFDYYFGGGAGHIADSAAEKIYL